MIYYFNLYITFTAHVYIFLDRKTMHETTENFLKIGWILFVLQGDHFFLFLGVVMKSLCYNSNNLIFFLIIELI